MAIVNRTGGQIEIGMFGENRTSHAVDWYKINISTGDPVTLSADPLSSGNYDYQTVTAKNGSIIGQVQLDEQEPAGEISCSFYEDFAYLSTKFIYGNSKNKMLNLFNGEAFINGDDIIVPIGTNGTMKSLTAQAKFHEMNKPYKYLLHNEGAFIKEVGTADENGNPAFKKNPFEATFNRSHKTVCFEFMTTGGDGQVNRMYPVVAKSTLEWAEGDINQFNFTGQRGCDMFERDNFFTEILSEQPAEGEGTLKELFVDYIVKHDATEPADATEGQLLANVDASGTVTIKKYSESSWSEDMALKPRIDIGTRIKSNKLIESGSSAQEVNTFVAIGADKKAVDFSSNSTKRFFCKVYNYSVTTQKFEEYVTE